MALNLLELKDIEEFTNLDPTELASHVVTQEEVRHLFELCDALWLHSGDVSQPHAELTSGKCSNGYIDCGRPLRRSYLCQFLGEQLAKKLRASYPDLSIDWVVGSDHAGAVISHSTAIALGTKHEFTEKFESTQQLWKRVALESTEIVLQVEELITTTQTLQAVREGIRSGNTNPVTFAPVVLTMIHRSPVYELEGSPILYLAHYDINVWEPSECSLCAQGSQRLRPKQHWKELTNDIFHRS